MAQSTLYWAAADLDTCVNEAEARRGDYYRFCQMNGFLWIWGLVYDFFYSGTNRAALAYTVGDQNELLVTKVNALRNLVQHRVGIIINQRPAWEVIAQNSDYDSLAMTAVAKGVLEYYAEVKGLDDKLYKTTVSTCKFGEGFVVTTWDQSQGAVISRLPAGKNEDGTDRITTIREGDLDVRVFEPVDIIRDCSITDHDQNHWYIVRERRNKYDLAMKYPEHYDEIVGSNLVTQPNEHYIVFDRQQQAKDLVYVYTLYHKKTAAVPNGRIVQYITPDLVLSDTPQLYDDFPVQRMVDSPIPGTNFSYTDTFDLLQLQDNMDGLVSSAMSSLRAFGVQNIAMPIGSNIPVQSLAGGLNVITFDPANGGAPQALQLCSIPPEVFNMMNWIDSKMGTISGVNGTAQGNPPTGVTSGVALSFLQAMNVQYAQGAQESYITTLSAVGTKVINILRQNAKTDRVISIVGNAKASMVSAFKGEDLQHISRVVARPGNPMMQTIQGRFAIAQEITKDGMTNEGANQLLTVLETGSLDALTEGRFNVDAQIKEENQLLREGKPVAVLAFDDHLAHINEHKAITADANLRTGNLTPEKAAILKSVGDHILEHIRYLQDPQYAVLLQVLGQQPLPPAQPGQVGAAAAAGPGTTNISLNAAGQAATAAGGAAPTSSSPVAQPQVKAPAAASTPVGQVPSGAINLALKK